MTLVFIFPGQSSRYPGMLHKLSALHPDNAQLLDAASDYLHRDLGTHYRADNAEAYARNRDIQIGVFLANQMFLQVLQAEGIEAELSCGLSLGEWNHLVHIGALDLRQALLAVEQRGLAYDDGPKGSMASVFPIDLEELEELAARTRELGVLEVVNLNSPRQQVLSGEDAPLLRALELIEEETFAQAVMIEKKIPMHCSTFAPVGARFRTYLESVPFTAPRRPYLPNRLGEIVESPEKQTFVELLSTHVHMPVLWRRSIDHLVQRHPEAVFVEVGPMSVLYNLLNKKWHRNKKFCADSREETATHLVRVIEDLHALSMGAAA
jgi:[acyl-carrier-protein] S-malonyltransferase